VQEKTTAFPTPPFIFCEYLFVNIINRLIKGVELVTKCNICGVDFTGDTNTVVICKHKSGNVHLGCCTDLCSWDGKPCGHAVGVFEKV
jgi:hypothetical protein